MDTVLMKAGAFIMIIIMGYILKKIKFFGQEHFKIISKIVLNITLPCAVISNFGKIKIEFSLLWLVFIGIVCNLIMVLVGYLTALRKDKQEKAFRMINYSGYNIGCFTMPYVQNFLGPIGVVATCLFDAGNSILCTGGTYAMASAVCGNGERTSVKSFLKKMFSSIPMDAYLIMLTLSLLHIEVPTFVFMFTETVGASNGFLAMLMVGIGLELNLEKGQLRQIITLLVLRYGIAAIFSALLYFFTPFHLEVRQVLALVVFAPISAICTAFTQKCGGDVRLASAINSISILCSIIIMTALLLGMKI